jgi:predicted metal-dependent phosphoesterase TrpH
VRIDLHAHTTASDGTESPTELLASAAAAGLDVIAITDHDTTSGWAAAAAAVPAGVTLIRGAELSCSAGAVDLHMLGYLFDPQAAELRQEMDWARDDRVPRARAIVANLVGAGVPLSWEQVAAQVPDGATVGRPHIADALVAAGVVPDRSAAFTELLHNDSPHFVGHYAVDPVRAVSLIRAAGGVAVFAHPGASKRGATVGDDVIAELAAAGLAALEVDHPDHDAATRERLRGLARELGLLVTGSSDYHGAGKPQRLGACTTDPEVYAELLARASATAPVEAVVAP